MVSAPETVLWGGFDAFVRMAISGAVDRLDNWVCLRRPDSTHSIARRLVDELAAEDETPRPTGFLALEQTAGRGRRGRQWASPAGGLYLSVVRPRVTPSDLEVLPVAIGVALAETVDGLGGRGCALKWPNDVLIDGRKVGGILLEALTREEGAILLASVGINIETVPQLVHDPGSSGRPATSLREAGIRTPAEEILRRLIETFLSILERVPDRERAVEAYRARSIHRPGDALVCRMGEEAVEGSFLGFDDRGFLRLATARGERLLSAGEILD